MRNLLYTLSISFLLFTFCNSWAQWSYVNTLPGVNTTANELYEDADGNIITAGGNFDWPYSDDGPVRVTKHDASGNLIWEAEIESPVGIGNISAGGIDETDGGYIIFCGGFEHPLIVKLSFDGEILWTSEAWSGGVSLGIAPQPTGYVQSDGTIVLASFDSSVPTQFVIFMVNPDGTLDEQINHATTVGTDMVISGYDLTESYSDDGFAVAGGALQGGATWMPYIWHFDNEGNQEWLTLYPSLTVMEAYGICNTSDGGFAVSCYDFFGGQTGIIKTDEDGVEEWSNSYAASFPGYIAYAYDIAQRTDGSYAMAHVNLDNLYIYYGTAEIVLVDSEGNETERKEVAAGASNWIQSIIGTSDGGFAFCGKFRTTDVMAPEYDQHFFVQKSSSTGDLPACIYNCVWPGDADNNGVANTDDILAIGVAYGAAGPMRTDASIGWYAHAAETWVAPATGGDELKYADSNGDGIINDDDTTAVSVNFGLEHELFVLKTAAGEIPLYIDAPETELPIGLNSLPVVLGDEFSFPDAIYGIRFTIEYESESIEANSVSFGFADSWMGGVSDMVTFRRNNEIEKKLDVAIVRNNQANASGYGDIGTLNFVVIDNIAGLTESGEATFTITDVRAIDIDWNEIAVEGSGVVVETEETTGINQQNALPVSIYPNPVIENTIYLHGNYTLIEYISLKDITGRIVAQYDATAFSNGTLQLGVLPSGAYTVEMIGNESVSAITILLQ